MHLLFTVFVILFFIGFVAVTSYLAILRVNSYAEIDWDALDDEAVQTALARGNKVEALKAYRRLTGQGLNEAKDGMDYAIKHPEARLEKSTKKKKATADSQDAGIRDLILEGRMDEAVEVYQKFAGVDAYTAKDAVDEIVHDLHQSATEGLAIADQLRQNKR